MVMGIAEAYVFRFRSSFISPIDFSSVGTALNVAGNYDFTPWKELVIVTALFVLWFILLFIFCPAKLGIHPFDNRKIRIGTGIALFILFAGLTMYVRGYDTEKGGVLDISENAFHSDKNNREEGAVIRFLYDSGYLSVDKPEGYAAS